MSFYVAFGMDFIPKPSCTATRGLQTLWKSSHFEKKFFRSVPLQELEGPPSDLHSKNPSSVFLLVSRREGGS